MEAVLAALAPALRPAFTLWGSDVTALELVAFVLALGTVAMNIRVNPLGWPLAIVSSLLYVGLFWNSRLYGDASLQVFFAVVALFAYKALWLTVVLYVVFLALSWVGWRAWQRRLAVSAP